MCGVRGGCYYQYGACLASGPFVCGKDGVLVIYRCCVVPSLPVWCVVSEGLAGVGVVMWVAVCVCASVFVVTVCPSSAFSGGLVHEQAVLLKSC